MPRGPDTVQVKKYAIPNDSKVWILWIKNHKPLILKGCSQRCGRASRTAVGKSYAIVYDYIHDHPIFIYQFYNRNKRNYRLKAYLQCTQVDEVVEELVRYMQSIARGKPLNKKHFKLLNENYEQVVVHIDEMPHLEIDD